MTGIQSADVPYGKEVFIIVPDRCRPTIESRREQVFDLLDRAFPHFKFSLGVGVKEHKPEEWRAVEPLPEEVQQAIVGHLHEFVASAH